MEPEHVPNFLKTGIIIPLYKGGSKDPLDANRGITLTSVLAKVFESLLLALLQNHLAERGIPHPNQTAYHPVKASLGTKAIFFTLEVLSQYSRH